MAVALWGAGKGEQSEGCSKFSHPLYKEGRCHRTLHGTPLHLPEGTLKTNYSKSQIIVPGRRLSTSNWLASNKSIQ